MARGKDAAAAGRHQHDSVESRLRAEITVATTTLGEGPLRALLAVAISMTSTK
jgi:hypothetical protein